MKVIEFDFVKNVAKLTELGFEITASSLPDVVPISVIPENKMFHAAPALAASRSGCGLFTIGRSENALISRHELQP